MKLARQQLKQIIKEEISKVLSENSTDAMKKFLLGISADFSPETTKSDIEQYALDLVDNEVEPQDFASGKLEWGDLVDELSIPIQNAKLIALSMKELGASETGDWRQSGVAQHAKQQEEAIPPEVEAAILTALEWVLNDDSFKTAIIDSAMERDGESVTPDNVTRTVGKIISQYQGL
jgi:hypothetical protein